MTPRYVVYRAASRASAQGHTTPAPSLPLYAYLEDLTPIQHKYLDKLDSELEKVEKFYSAREREACAQAARLHQQLISFSCHRDVYDAQKDQGQQHGWLGAARCRFGNLLPSFLHFTTGRNDAVASNAPAIVVDDVDEKPVPDAKVIERSVVVHSRSFDKLYAPNDYDRARRKLRRALSEHYRLLEALNNYRVGSRLSFLGS